MQVSELLSALQKVQQLAKDVPVIVRDVEHDIETELQTIGIRIDPSSDGSAGRVELEHGGAPATTPVTPPAPDSPPAAD